MPSVQSFTITYNSLNRYGTFSEGDTLNGKVTLALSKAITAESLFVKLKGDARVHWTKKVNDRTQSYTANRRFFKLKEFFIPEESKDITVPPGTHIYDFSFHIPPGNMPSSFRGTHGKIVYKLEAKLSRSWRMDCIAEKEVNFVSKSIPNLPNLMSRQISSTNKEMGFFSKGSAHMEVIVDRAAFAPGESVAIVAKVNNSSSSDMTPKFSLIRDVVFRAQGHTKHENYVVLKAVDSCVKPQTEKTVKCAMKIPGDVTLSIQNCDIISVEYSLKVYLDISFATDPKVVFPVVIYPPSLAPGPQPGGPSHSDFLPPAAAMGPYPAAATGSPRHSDFPPPALAMGPYPAGAFGGPSYSSVHPTAMAMGPHTYGQPGAQNNSYAPPAYPAQPPHASGGYNNPVPQRAFPYGDPFSSPSSRLHPPPPTAPTFHPPPSAPEPHPPPFPAQPNVCPTAPAYNFLASAPAMNTDFLSESDEAPPSYSILFPSSATDSKL